MKIERHAMYAVSLDGVGLIAGTLAYSRREAIRHFQHGNFIPSEWEAFRRAGYRTVKALVEIVGPFGRRRTTRGIR